jgi:hypothetical protein
MFTYHEDHPAGVDGGERDGNHVTVFAVQPLEVAQPHQAQQHERYQQPAALVGLVSAKVASTCVYTTCARCVRGFTRTWPRLLSRWSASVARSSNAQPLTRVVVGDLLSPAPQHPVLDPSRHHCEHVGGEPAVKVILARERALCHLAGCACDLSVRTHVYVVRACGAYCTCTPVLGSW